MSKFKMTKQKSQRCVDALLMAEGNLMELDNLLITTPQGSREEERPLISLMTQTSILITNLRALSNAFDVYVEADE